MRINKFRKHAGITGKMVMIEYIFIKGINDSRECAHHLGKLLNGRNVHVNLIPYNPTSAGDRYNFQCPTNESIVEFADIVKEYDGPDGTKLAVFIRWSTTTGREVDGACGQLALKVKNKDLEDGVEKTKAAAKGRPRKRLTISTSSDQEKSSNDEKQNQDTQHIAEPWWEQVPPNFDSVQGKVCSGDIRAATGKNPGMKTVKAQDIEELVGDSRVKRGVNMRHRKQNSGQLENEKARTHRLLSPSNQTNVPALILFFFIVLFVTLFHD